MTKTLHTYRALSQPLPILSVGPDGMKRPIQTFPKVFGAGGAIIRGLEAFRQHLPSFLRERRGSEPVDPGFGSSLHELLAIEDEQWAAEIVRRVVHDEIPGRFGKYLDAIHAFDVTPHRETRTMHVLLAVKPHGAEAMSWDFELRFASGGEEHLASRPHPGPEVMNDPRAAELIRVARHYYPAGFPVWEDDDEEPVPAYQRTPEYQRWDSARQRAWDDWKQWTDFLESLKAVFSGHDIQDVTPPSVDACCRCCLYLRESQSDGSRVITRVVGAVSILAPLYLVYVTTVRVRPDGTATRPQLTFEPVGEAKPYADELTRHIERTFGYRPFPLDLADVPLTDLRIHTLYGQPTLLGALFAARDALGNLP
jgi:hypothetical protein